MTRGLAGVATCLALLALGCVSPAGAPARDPRPPPHISKPIKKIGRQYAGSQSPMPRHKVRRILKVVWRHFCCKRKHSKLRHRVIRNMRQIRKDSSFRPGARSPTGQHAKGLLQMQKPVFEKWSVPGYTRVTNPVHDILAAVNIQDHARTVVSVSEPGYVYPHNILNGRHGGWGLHGGDNPYR
jgi:hypothetical protein